MSILTVSESKDIQSPPGNSLALFLDKFGNLQLKDVNGKTIPLSEFISSSGGGTPTLPDVFLGNLSDTITLSEILDNYNLTVEEGSVPVLFLVGGQSKGSQSTGKRYLWKLGSGEFNPIGSENINSKLELIQETFISNNDLEIILSGANAQEVALGVINENFITYMNSNGPYVFTDVNKTYVITFTQDAIDYAYIFQGTLGTYGSGQLQFVSDDFIFIYQSTNAGEPTNSTYIRITTKEAITLKASSSFVPGAIYVITDADSNLYGGTEVTLTAITSNQLSLQGSGLFYCPKYDLTAEGNGYGIWTTYMEGEFQNIIGSFTLNETVTAQNGATAIYLAEGFLQWVSGDWSAAVEIGGESGTCEVFDFVSPSYAQGQIVHWGGKSWTNLNGNVGENVDKYTLDAEWQEIPFNTTDYNVYVDEIQYAFDNDMIIYRKDRYNNIVSGSNQVFVEFESPNSYFLGNPIKDFQWGCAQDNFNTNDYFEVGIRGNQVIDSYCETLNFIGKYFSKMVFHKKSYLSSIIFSKNSSMENNNFDISSFFANSILNRSRIFYNCFLTESYLDNCSLNSTQIYNNNFQSSSLEEQILKNRSLFGITFKDVNINMDLSNSTVIFNSASKNIFRRSNLVPRLQYVNNSDVIVITDVDA
jgi:hypothetical protein